MATFCMPVAQANLRRLDDPHGVESRFSYFALVKVNDIPADIPLDVNPRDQNLRSSVAGHIRKGLAKMAEDFYLLNQGITIIADVVYYDSRRNELVLEFPDYSPSNGNGDEQESDESSDMDNNEDYLLDSFVGTNRFGIVNGGHTYKILLEAKQNPEAVDDSLKECPPAYVRLEILGGIKNELALNLARARNTANSVKEQSMQELGRNFQWIKDTIADQPFRDKIAYRENESRVYDKPIEIRQVIQILAALHPDYLSRDRQPTVSYSQAATCLKRHGEEEVRYQEATKKKQPLVPKGYRQLRPILIDVLRLYDYIRDRSSEIYNHATGGRSGAKNEFEKHRIPQTLHFLDHESSNGKLLHNSCVMPILSSFRALIEIDPETNEAQWCAGIDPFQFFETEGGGLLQNVFEASSELRQNFNAIGKSTRLWRELFKDVAFIKDDYIARQTSDTKDENSLV